MAAEQVSDMTRSAEGHASTFSGGDAPSVAFPADRHLSRGSPTEDLSPRERLLCAGLRPTRQRILLTSLLFGKCDRHVTAESLFHEASRREAKISLATVYNTLRQFQRIGLLREITVGGGRVYYDTNTSSHYHFLIEDTNDLIDIPASNIVVEFMRKLPPGVEIMHVDVVIRMRAGSCFGCGRLIDCVAGVTQANELCGGKFLEAHKCSE